ncbi:unnamed protein product [Rodentolepis nana]|uniref:Uncharacterized protein n=1 Tax=Rodentolepis nana TaxID=102285 RepID=A0A0R3TXA5_RODNA|nr:unnamed protein product [Rodentolepis nana]
MPRQNGRRQTHGVAMHGGNQKPFRASTEILVAIRSGKRVHRPQCTLKESTRPTDESTTRLLTPASQDLAVEQHHPAPTKQDSTRSGINASFILIV